MTEIEKSLGELAEEINAEHRAYMGSLRATVEHGIRCGELLAEAKEQCPRGSWLYWLEQNFDGSVRSAQEYMRLFRHRDEIRAKRRATARLTMTEALNELPAPDSTDLDMPERELLILDRAKELREKDEDRLCPLDPIRERVANLPEEKRLGVIAELAWAAMICQGREYFHLKNALEEDGIENLTPELLAQIQAEAENLRWGVQEVEWLEQQVRPCDYPPSRGMPQAAFDEEKRNLALCELYAPSWEEAHDDPNRLVSPRDRIRDFCGPVV